MKTRTTTEHLIRSRDELWEFVTQNVSHDKRITIGYDPAEMAYKITSVVYKTIGDGFVEGYSVGLAQGLGQENATLAEAQAKRAEAEAKGAV